MSNLVATTTLTPTNASDAAFRAWGSAISTKLAAAGLVKTADTGQINWATVLAPTSGPVVQGYEVWRFADALQASAPVFFLLQFGSGSGNCPSFWITFGSGSNGAGALTGIQSTIQQVFANTSASAFSCYWCGHTNRFIACLYAGAGSTILISQMFSFERTVDASGVATSEGVLLTFKAGAGSTFSQMLWACTTGEATAPEGNLGILVPSAGTGSNGSQIATYPIFHAKGVFANPGLNCLAYFNADITALSTVAFSYYGATHTYMPIGTTIVPGNLRGGNTLSVMMRYE